MYMDINRLKELAGMHEEDDKNTLLGMLNTYLPDSFSAIHKPSDDIQQYDDSIEILYDGQETGLAVQLSEDADDGDDDYNSKSGYMVYYFNQKTKATRILGQFDVGQELKTVRKVLEVLHHYARPQY